MATESSDRLTPARVGQLTLGHLLWWPTQVFGAIGSVGAAAVGFYGAPPVMHELIGDRPDAAQLEGLSSLGTFVVFLVAGLILTRMVASGLEKKFDLL